MSSKKKFRIDTFILSTPVKKEYVKTYRHEGLEEEQVFTYLGELLTQSRCVMINRENASFSFFKKVEGVTVETEVYLSEKGK